MLTLLFKSPMLLLLLLLLLLQEQGRHQVRWRVDQQHSPGECSSRTPKGQWTGPSFIHLMFAATHSQQHCAWSGRRSITGRFTLANTN
jgi:hypothetical protein